MLHSLYLNKFILLVVPRRAAANPQNFRWKVTYSAGQNVTRSLFPEGLYIGPVRSPIWCEGSLLHAVQLSGLFPDCKTFVDMPLKYDSETTLQKWNALVSLSAVSNDVLALFLRENFDEPEGELEECAPDDWYPQTDQFDTIVDENYRKFACALHAKWPTLHRRISKKVLVNPEKYSIIPVPNPFIVPGGRFREMYYWDSFFTIKGLLASGMLKTVRGMIDNMKFLVETFGFIPNGNRVYYLNRSQPPLLTWAVYALFEETNDLQLLKDSLPTLRKELTFFQANKSIHIDDWSTPLFRFTVQAVNPRPESYREDLESAEHLDDDDEKCVLWGDIAAAAESGRDFSSRWFSIHGPYAGKLESTRTSKIIPVELNAIICGNIRLMGLMYEKIGDDAGVAWARNLHTEMIDTIKNVLWNEEHGIWFDYDLEQRKQLITYNDTNFFPLYTQSTHDGFDSKRVADYLTSCGAMAFTGGIPVSLVNSGEQWDFPNAWAPTTWIMIEGFRINGHEDLARRIAGKWIQKNFNLWRASGGRMFEKYNVVSPCYRVKGGGEYVMQEGFGWTNGVILDLLKTYGHTVRWMTTETCECCDVNIQRYIKPVEKTISRSSSIIDTTDSNNAGLHADYLESNSSVGSPQSMKPGLTSVLIK